MERITVGILFILISGASHAQRPTGVTHDVICQDGSVISYSDWCDNKYDCPYGDDEDCSPAEVCDFAYAHRCSDTGRCISGHAVCDGRADCPNGEDESYYECWSRRSTSARYDAFTRQVNPWDFESEKRDVPNH